MDRANLAALWMLIGLVVVSIGLFFVVPALNSAPAEAPSASANPSVPSTPASESASSSASSAHSGEPAPPAPQQVDDQSTPGEARAETEPPAKSAVKSIRMFPPFPNGRIKWEGFYLPVVPASQSNVRAYLIRMSEFYDEFARADRCCTQQERIEQAGRFIIHCDAEIGFDGIVVPDSHVEWTKLFVKVIQIRAESMYLPWGPEEIEFRLKHKEEEIHAQANALLEALQAAEIEEDSENQLEFRSTEGGERVLERYVFGDPSTPNLHPSADGQKKSEGYMLDNGKKVGTWTYWYGNGQKWKEGTYKDGKEEGVWEYWYPHGPKWKDETWENGWWISTVRYENGKKVEQ